MPRPPPLDLSGIDQAELELELRALFDECNVAAPEMRPLWRTQFSELLSEAGGARKILAVAIARIRERG
jgi:hypothetical protein